MVRLTLPLFAALALMAGAVAAHEEPSDAHDHGRQRLDLAFALEKSEAAIGRIVDDYALIDAEGKVLTLAEFRGKPLVISPIYTSCPMVCPTTTQHLVKAVSRARKVFGPGRFAVLTVSFDPRRDTPTRLAAFMNDQNVNLADWRIAVGDQETTERFMADLGFSYRAGAGGFHHVTQTTILDRDGRVHRQVYGDAFPIQIFLEPLKEVVFGTSIKSLTMSNLIDRIRFICTVYNPGSGRYETDYSIVYGISIGGLSLLLTGFIIFRTWRHDRRVRSDLSAAEAGKDRTNGGLG